MPAADVAVPDTAPPPVPVDDTPRTVPQPEGETPAQPVQPAPPAPPIAPASGGGIGASPDAEARSKGNQIFRRGQKCYEDLNYSCAESAFREATNYVNDPKYHVYLAYTFAATDRQKLAVDEFAAALRLDSAITVDPKEQSPKIIRAYDLAREQVAADETVAKESIIKKGSAFIDELFRDTISTVTSTMSKPFLPEKPQGLMWKDVPMNSKSRYTLALGFNVPVDDKYAGRNEAFQPDIALMAGYAYQPQINHFAFGGRLIYSRNKQRNTPGPVALEVATASGFFELHQPVEAFLLFGRAEVGGAFSGIDSLTQETGLMTGGSAGISALVTDRVSLEISATFQALFGAGTPNRNPSYRMPFFFGVNYLY